MTRIIAGSAGGRRLRTPAGTGTRPTSDRVREALFSSLGSQLGTLAGSRFLDLFAGSGAVGLEARSRGAAHVMLVERDAAAAALIRSNAAALGFDEVEVVARPAETLTSLPPVGGAFDIVFLDPPYDLPAGDLAALLARLLEHGWLTDDALVVAERPRRDRAWQWPDAFEPDRSKRYGETVLWYGRRAVQPGRDVG